MPSLPAGTVTFLFTDIEGSTRLLQQLGDRYAEVLATHHRLLCTAIQGAHGHEVDTQGMPSSHRFLGPGMPCLPPSRRSGPCRHIRGPRGSPRECE